MAINNNIVAVQFKNRNGEGYGDKEYSYYAQTPLEVGQLIKVPTKYGESQARVSKVGISEETLPLVLRGNLKKLTSNCILLEASGEPCMDNQEQIDLQGMVEDFFKQL